MRLFYTSPPLHSLGWKPPDSYKPKMGCAGRVTSHSPVRAPLGWGYWIMLSKSKHTRNKQRTNPLTLCIWIPNTFPDSNSTARSIYKQEWLRDTWFICNLSSVSLGTKCQCQQFRTGSSLGPMENRGRGPSGPRESSAKEKRAGDGRDLLKDRHISFWTLFKFYLLTIHYEKC